MRYGLEELYFLHFLFYHSRSRGPHMTYQVLWRHPLEDLEDLLALRVTFHLRPCTLAPDEPDEGLEESSMPSGHFPLPLGPSHRCWFLVAWNASLQVLITQPLEGLAPTVRSLKI